MSVKTAQRQADLGVPAATIREQLSMRIGRDITLDQLADMLDALEAGSPIPDPIVQASERAAAALDDESITIAQIAERERLSEADIFQAALIRRHNAQN